MMEKAKLTDKEVNEQLREVYNFRSKSEKLSWMRKRKRIESLIEQLKPYEERILEITREKQPILDKINKARKDMKKDCVHPRDMLLHNDSHILCKFCSRKIKMNIFDNNDSQEKNL